MHRARKTVVHRFSAQAPDDLRAIQGAIDGGELNPSNIVAVLGKTEGNGCVNDFTRGFASLAIKQAIASWCGQDAESVARRVAIIMSGGTEGGLSPHWLVFEVRDDGAPREQPGLPSLATGVAMTRTLAPDEIGRMAQVLATAEAVTAAMQQAGIERAEDVHYVQVKCPLLTRARIGAAEAQGKSVATQDTYLSMGYSRGASALGVALALGEVRPGAVGDPVICRDPALYSGRASTSAGIELMENQVMVLGNSSAWTSDFVIGHSVMKDAIDVRAAAEALAASWTTQTARAWPPCSPRRNRPATA
jgi:cyanuric acid amidohydrolase